VIEILTAAVTLFFGFVMGAAWFEWRHTNRRARWISPPSGSYGLPADHDWRRSFTHECTNPPTGEPPLKLNRSVRFAEVPPSSSAQSVVERTADARRLKQHALTALSRADKDAVTHPLTGDLIALRTYLTKDAVAIIRCALKAIPDT
jgi:hypothetical protein